MIDYIGIYTRNYIDIKVTVGFVVLNIYTIIHSFKLISRRQIVIYVIFGVDIWCE